MRKDYNSIVVGCGFAGAVVARELAERGEEKVLLGIVMMFVIKMEF